MQASHASFASTERQGQSIFGSEFGLTSAAVAAVNLLSMSKPPQGPLRPLLKQQSWSPDILREEAWERRKGNEVKTGRRHRLTKSLSEDDLNELKACIELGFGFGSDFPDLDPKLSDTIPALEFYRAVIREYSKSLSRSSSSSSLVSDHFDYGSPNALFDSGDDPKVKKAKLKQWAQVVACAVRESSSSSSPSPIHHYQ